MIIQKTLGGDVGQDTEYKFYINLVVQDCLWLFFVWRVGRGVHFLWRGSFTRRIISLGSTRATSPGRTKHKGKLSLRSCAGDGRLTDEPRIKVSSKERWLTANNFQHSRGLIKESNGNERKNTETPMWCRKGSGRYQQDQGAVKGEEWKEQRTVNSPALGDSFQMER